jgi:PAS domain-containing protein
MESACLRCHNDPASGSPYTSWKVGDVRGVLEIVRPLDNSVAESQRALIWTFAGTVALYGLGLLGLGVVVGRLRRASASERESQAHTQAIVDTAADGILTIDDQGLIGSFNDAAVRLFGFERAEVVGRHVSLLLPALDAKQQARAGARTARRFRWRWRPAWPRPASAASTPSSSAT